MFICAYDLARNPRRDIGQLAPPEMPSSDALSFEACTGGERERNKKEFEIAKTTEAIFMNGRTNERAAAGNNNDFGAACQSEGRKLPNGRKGRIPVGVSPFV